MGTKAETLRAMLTEVGERRARAVAEKAKASQELAILIPRALDAGLSPIEVARLTGLSRQAVYDFSHSDHV